MDILRVSRNLYDKNLYAYCDNNPIARKDISGNIWETVFDIVTLGISIADVLYNPTDVFAWAGLIGDTIDLLPVLTGTGEFVRAIEASQISSDIGRNVHAEVKYTKKVLRQMDNVNDLNHAFPTLIDTMVDVTQTKPITGGDGIIRKIIEVPGSINDRVGMFEYIIEVDGKCNHRFFKAIR